MKRSRFIMVGLALIFLIYVFFIVYQDIKKESKQNTKANQEQIKEQQWETKTDEQPPITVIVTPLELGRSVPVWKFGIVLDTHSGSLDEDLLAAATLVDDKFNVYQPTNWEGPGPGGHHREGVLAFEAIDPIPSYVELKIKNVGGVTERSFNWTIK